MSIILFFYYLLILLILLESFLYVCIGVIFNCQTVRCKIFTNIPVIGLALCSVLN